MTGDALSDFILAAVCSWIVFTEAKTRPGVAMGSGCTGFAAYWGVLHFSGLQQAAGPHAFFSMIAATAGFPLLAAALCWPHGMTATRPAAAVRFLLIFSAIAIALLAAGFSLWKQIAPGIAGVAILIAAVRSQPDPKNGGLRNMSGIAGAVALLASFAATATNLTLGPLNSTQLLHYLMALGFGLISLQGRRLKVEPA